MTAWLIRVVAVVLFISLLTVMIPDGKTGKFIKPILSLVIVGVIFTPILYGFDKTGGLTVSSGKEYGNALNYDEKYIYFVFDKKIENCENNCKDILSEYGINGATVTIQYSVDKDYSVSFNGVFVNLKNAVINGEEENINLVSEIKKKLAEYLHMDEKDVTVYGQ